MNFKYLFYSILLILVLVVSFGAFLHFRTARSITPLKNKIDSLNTLISTQKNEIKFMKAKIKLKNADQDRYEKIADSLDVLLKEKPHNLKQANSNLRKQNIALRTALKKCKEIKGIQSRTIQTYDGLVNNYEIKELDIKKLHSIELKERKKKGFLIGAGTVGTVVVVIAIILIL